MAVDEDAAGGPTAVVGARYEDSNGAGGPTDNSAPFSGAAYVFVRSGATWNQQGYLKASNAEQYDSFGSAVAVAGDTVVVGAYAERSNGTGGPSDNSAQMAGAAYVYVRNGATWTEQAYLKASNAEADDLFGRAVAVDEDAAGDPTVVVGAYHEDGNGAGGPTDNSAPSAGAVYVFVNEPEPNTITIVKEATPADDTPFDFTESITSGTFSLSDPSDNSVTFSNVTPGTYTVIETGETGWTLDDITCDNANSTGDTGTRTATINLEDGEAITCTFGNSRDTGTIVIAKEASPSDDTVFDFTETIPGAGSGFTLSDPGDTTETFSNVPTGSYQVTELAEPGWTLDDITCIDPDNGSSDDAPTATIDLDNDETVTCTFGNSRDTGTITIVKAATPEDNTPFTFTETIPGAGSGFTLSDPGDTTETFSNVPTGSYSVAENVTAGWGLANLVCDDANSTENLATATATINLEKGEAVTCTFSNSQLPPATAGIYVSAVSAGNTGDGLAFGPHDILLWDDGWTKWFDGTAAQLKPNGNAVHNINALWIPDTAGDDVVLAFAQDARAVVGVSGKVDGTDLVWWNGSAFSLWFDGQDVGLSVLAKEKIDALHVLDGSQSPIGGSCQYYLLLSTAGDGQVANYSGGVIKFDGTDVLGFCMTNSGANTAGFWHRVLNGKAEGMPGQALVNLSASDDGQVLYLTTRAAFNVDAAHGSHSMVYRYDRSSGQFSGPFFSAPANGLNRPVDGLQVDGELP